MNTRDTAGSGRERRIFTALVAGTALVLCAIAFGLLMPLQKKRAEIAEAIQHVDDQLATLPDGGAGPATWAEYTRAQEEMQRLAQRWTYLTDRLDSFKTPPSFTRDVDPTEEGRIDFKVALFEARSLLLEKAEAGGVALPGELGMDETITAHEDAETRLWQLTAVVKLIENCIDIGISRIDRIDVLAPYDHVLPEGDTLYAREFPARIGMACSYDEMLQLMDLLLDEGSFFALRGFRAERQTKYRRDPLAITAIYSGELFDVRPRPVEETAWAEPLPVNAGPMEGLMTVTNRVAGDPF